jgi:hypothetical protein
MSKDTDNSLFIDSSMQRFYQQLFGGIANYRELGNRIINRIKAAHAFRQIEQVRELSRMLINVPIKEYQLIAQFYLVWCKCRDYEYPTATLEKIIEQTRTYKTKALFSRAAIEIYHGNLENALYFYGEAFKSHPTVSEYIDLSRSIAGLKSLEGFHDSALRDLEKLIPLIKYAEPRLYYDFLNSYAVELGEVGRKDEARNVINHVVASPFIQAYPEWSETADELKEPSRSFIAAPSIEPEPVEIEATEIHLPGEPDQPATVLAFPALKEAPQPQKPDRLTPQQVAELTLSDMRELILAAIKTGAIQESQYIKMMGMVGLLKNGPADNILVLRQSSFEDWLFERV